MNEMNKTLAFAGAAFVAIVLAWEPWQYLQTRSTETPESVTRLFPRFDDPKKAKSIQIVKFNEDNGSLSNFSVKQINGRWVIPSHNDYPADAREHMAQAAVTVLDLESLNVVSDRPGDFELFGVVAPDASKLKPGATGVGMQVVFRGAEDALLADLIVGKKDKDHPDVRFVRVAGRDQIYKVRLNTDKLSTKFQDWIEKDLLKLNPLDVRQLQLNDYSIKRGVDQQGREAIGMEPHSNIKLSYNDDKSKWNIEELKEYNAQGEASEGKLAEDEELNVDKLNGLKNALGDLKIIDVQRKPAGLSQDLRIAEDLKRNREMMTSLVKRGFYPYQLDNGQTELASSEGEVIAYLKDGIEYTLRFGATTVAETDEEEDSDKPGSDKADADKSEAGKTKKSRLSRYLMVTSRFLEDRIPKPDLQEVPPGPDDEKKDEEKMPAEGQPGEEKPAEGKGDEGKTDAAAPEIKASPEPAGDKQSSSNAQSNVFRLTADEKPAEKEIAPAQKSPAESAAPAEPSATAPAAGDATPDADEDKGGKIRAQAREAKELADKRAIIEKDNKRKQAAYDEKIKAGKKRNQELNDRFADWYYVISDEVYHKIHLTRSDVIKTKEKAAGKGNGLGDLNALENAGLGGLKHDHDHDHDHEEKK